MNESAKVLIARREQVDLEVLVPLPPLPEDWEPTRATLHAYALAVGAVPRAHAAFHPRWWHVSLVVRSDGLVTDSMPVPGGGSVVVRMDFGRHMVVVETDAGWRREVSMAAGLTGTELGAWLIATFAALGLAGEYDTVRFANDEPQSYDPAAAETFWHVLTGAERVLAVHRNGLSGEVGPIQFWPHGFDLAFEWFGTRVESSEEDGVVTEHPAQLNLGFYPAGRAYFFSNPWPFEADRLLGTALPSGAEWHTEGWEGSILSYDLVAGMPDADERVLAYAGAVYEVAAPTLTA